MKRLLLYISAIIIVCVLTGARTASRISSVKAHMDSAVILMGNQTSIHVEVVGELDGTGYFVPNDSLWKDVELAGASEPVVTDLGNNRKELKKDFIIQGFDSGLYNLPTIYYVQGNETVAANKVTLKVLPVNVDTLKTIHDYADVVSPGRNFFDFLPDWVTDYGLWILLALLVIGASVYIYIRYLRKGKIPLMPKKKPEPPYDVAMRALDNLRNQHLCERGEEKEFYTRLTDILRVYLDKRFGINAMEMTSSQILKAVRANADAKMSEEQMQGVLEVADFVKFAKMRPLPDDNARAFGDAVKFVEDTKPVVLPEGNGSDGNNPQTNNSKN